MNYTQAEVDAQVLVFVQALTKYLNDTNINANLYTYVIEVQTGPKNIRLVRREIWNGSTEATNGSAYCFIDRATGNILKPAGFKAPAKGARGNIFNADSFGNGKACGPYGVAYLR